MFHKKKSDQEYNSIPLDVLTADGKTVVEKEAVELNAKPSDEAALLAVPMVGPRVYELKGFHAKQLKFFVVGCHGTGTEAQQAVAQLMNEKALKEGSPAFMLFLGDNIYPNGTKNPLDPSFETKFDDVYYNEKYSGINSSPSFVTLGNHDSGQHKAAKYNPWFWGMQGKAMEINEVGRTYVPNSSRTAQDNHRKFKQANEIKNYFKQTTLRLKDLQAWNMPYFFYSLIAGDTQIFCLNSNTLAKEFVLLKQAGNDPEKLAALEKDGPNQALWLINAYQKARDSHKKIMFAMHNPLITQTKRALPNSFDTGLYLLPDQIAYLNNLLQADTQSHGELLALIFRSLDMNPDVCFTAHDHNLHYYNSRQTNVKELSHDKEKLQVCQVGAGGGGGDLQRRESFRYQPNTGCYLSRNGFVTVTCSLNKPDAIHFEFNTIAGQCLKFTQQSHLAVRKVSRDDRVEHLRNIVLKTCEDYFHELNKKDGLSIESEEDADEISDKNNFFEFFKQFPNQLSTATHTINHLLSGTYNFIDIDVVQDIFAYFNQPELKQLGMVLSDFCYLLEKLADTTPTAAFQTLFDKNYYEYHLFDGKKQLHDSLMKTLLKPPTPYVVRENANPAKTI